jgi:hypothetical protein
MGCTLADLWEYDHELDAWTELTASGDVPPARAWHIQVHIGPGKILVGLGRTGATTFAGDFFIYHTDTRLFRRLTLGASPTARESATSAELGGQKFLVRGGHDGANEIFDNWIFDVAAEGFTQILPTGNPPVRLEAAGFATNKALLYGQGRTFLYDHAIAAITELNVTGPNADSGHRMARVDDDVVVVGGQKGAKALGEVWRFDTAKKSWRQIADAGVEPVVGHDIDALISATRKTPIVFGGTNFALGKLSGGAPVASVYSDQLSAATEFGFTLGWVGGKTGVRLGEGVSEAAGVRDLFTHTVNLESVVTSIDADIPAGTTLKIAVSVDGVNFHEVILGKEFTFPAPGKKIRWRIWMTSPQAGRSPTVFKVILSFKEAGGNSAVFIQFEANGSGAKYLNMDADGVMTYSSTKTLTTGAQALLLKIIESGGNPPAVTNYKNQRVLAESVIGDVAAGAATLALNWGVSPRAVKAESYNDSTKAQYRAEITSADHESVVLAVTSGDKAEIFAVA